MNKEKRSSRIGKIALSLAFVLIALTLISGPGCGNQWMLFYDKPINGYVVDAETGKPIEGIIVIAMWQLTQYLSHGFGGYAKVIEVKTDKEGKFRIPFWVTFKPWKFNSPMDDLAPEIMIYKPGYKFYYSHKIMRAGYPGDISKTAEQKRWVKEEYSINPSKLRRIYADEEIWASFSEFESQRASYEYYSKKQLVDMFNTIEKGTSALPETNYIVKGKILKDINDYKQYWVEGKR